MSKSPDPKLSRRRVFAGAGTVGALAATAAVLPLAPRGQGPVASDAQATDDAQGRYQLTAHVRQYYQTTKV